MLAAVALAAIADVRVIGAGFGRSGTASLAAALKELGHKVFHAEDSFENSGVWADLFRARFRLACKRAGMGKAKFELDCTQFRPPTLGGQMRLL